PHALVFHQLHLPPTSLLIVVFFFIDTAATVLYTLSLHDALPICEGHADRVLLVRRRRHRVGLEVVDHAGQVDAAAVCPVGSFAQDRKSTRLNSSHVKISYAVFCLKKKTSDISKHRLGTVTG